MSDENNKANSVCDAGCGVGSLALPMSKLYKKVSASDISSSMTKEAAARAKASKLNNLDFKVADMETLGGKYNTVTCIDVMIHYPTDKVLMQHRCSYRPRRASTIYSRVTRYFTCQESSLSCPSLLLLFTSQ
jgi:magnesium-protoporphyrin O-methyltransferase